MPAPASPPRARARPRPARRGRVVALTILVVLAVAAFATPAAASTVSPVLAAPPSLQAVITNLRNWLVGLLVALATLFLTVGGVRYMLAGSDPGEVTKARNTLRYALLGYALAALAPLLVQVLQRVVGV